MARSQLLQYVKFLREHDSDLDDRTVHNIFETLNTFLRTQDILIAGKIRAEPDYAEKPPKPYTKQELKDMFAAMDDEQKLLYGLFLNSGVRDAEMQNTEYADFKWEKCTLHVQPKAWRKLRLKGKSKKKSAKDRFIPIPAKLVWKIKERMRQRNAQPHDLIFRTAKANLTVTSCTDYIAGGITHQTAATSQGHGCRLKHAGESDLTKQPLRLATV